MRTYTSHSWKSNRGTVRLWQPMCIIFKQKPRGMVSAVTPLPYVFLWCLWNAHNIVAKIYENDPQTLSEVIKLVEKLNRAQQVTATLTPPAVNVMLNVDQCLVCSKRAILVTTAPLHSGITVMALVTLPSTVQRKSPHQEHLATMTDHAPDHITTTTAETDHSPFITDAARKDTSIVQGHTPISLWQKLQQLSEACIPLCIPPPQQFMITIHQRDTR